MSVTDLDALSVALRMDATQYEAMINHVEAVTRAQCQDMINAANKAEKSMVSSFDKIGRQAQMMGRQLSAYLTAPIVAVGTAAVYEFGRFDDAVTKAYAIIKPATTELKKELADTAKALSLKSEFDPAQLAGGLKELSAAGLDAKQSMSALPIVERFATAGAFDLASATQLLMDSQSALGMVEKDEVKNRENLLRVSDALVRAGDQSTASPKQFAEALANGAADAKQYGMELEEVMAVLDAFAMKGNKGASAGSDLGRGLRLTTRAVNENGDAWKRYGIQATQANGEMVRYTEIIAGLEKAMKGLSGPQRAMMLQQLGFESLAQNAILPLVGMSDAIREWTKEQKNNADYTKNTAAIQAESYTQGIKRMWHEIQLAGMAIGEDLAPYVVAVTRYFVDAVKWTTAWVHENQGLAAGLIGTAAVLGPVLVGVGGLIVGLGALSAALGTTAVAGAAAWLAVAWPVAVAAGVIALTVAVANYTEGLQEAVTWNDKLLKDQKEYQSATLAKADTLEGDDKNIFLSKEIGNARTQLNGYNYAIEQTQKELSQMGERWDWVFHVDDINRLKEQLRGLGNSASAVRSNLAKMEEERQKVIDAKKNGVEESAVTKEHQTGVTEAAANITPEMQKLAGDVQEYVTKTKEANAILKLQAEAMDYSAGAAHLFALRVKGADDAMLSEAKAAHEVNLELEKQKDAFEKAKQSAEKLKNEGEALTKKFATPMEKFKEDQNHLDEMLKEGVISTDTYNKALAELEGQMKKDYRVDFQTTGAEGMKAGSLKALVALEDFQRGLLTGNAKGVLVKNGVNPKKDPLSKETGTFVKNTKSKEDPLTKEQKKHINEVKGRRAELDALFNPKEKNYKDRQMENLVATKRAREASGAKKTSKAIVAIKQRKRDLVASTNPEKPNRDLDKKTEHQTRVEDLLDTIALALGGEKSGGKNEIVIKPVGL